MNKERLFHAVLDSLMYSLTLSFVSCIIYSAYQLMTLTSGLIIISIVLVVGLISFLVYNRYLPSSYQEIYDE